ncbi:DUF29 domain-containing protein [Tumidithrix helvetica PCC 7403]|uniref:DUF29 domain-containing protein n=1 Tax=Tumidithrix helvetica TaxID=3457545 RepID=UPI003CC12750
MTALIKPDTLYDRDFNLWLEQAIAQLQSGDLHNLDRENLIEELQGLANRDKRELQQRLKVLLEHLLKRRHVDLPECFRGWEITIVNQRSEIESLLEQSPSLKRYLSEVFDKSWQTALKLVRLEYPETVFPDIWQFPQSDAILTEKLW